MGDTMSIVPFPKLIIRAKIGWLSFIFNYDAVIEHTVISGLHPKILSYKGCGCCHSTKRRRRLCCLRNTYSTEQCYCLATEKTFNGILGRVTTHMIG